MILYLIKSALCMALLLVVYHLVLEKEKMHVFNRFFLLFSLVFSLTVPFITLQSFSPALGDIPLVEIERNVANSLSVDPQSPMLSEAIANETGASKTIRTSTVLAWIYAIVGLFVIARLARNMTSIITRAKKAKRTTYKQAQIALVSEKVTPHSFFNFIFINEQQYDEGAINKAVLDHELAHIKQMHSIDILFIELLRIVFWFNPVLHFYKKAIQLNHEFLADEAAIGNSDKVSDYQHTLLGQIDWGGDTRLASNLNFSLTKKRLTMMNKKTSKYKAFVIKAMLVPLVASFVLLFSTKVDAQSSGNSASKLVDEILALSKKESLNDNEKKRLGTITFELFNMKGVYINDDQARFLRLLKAYKNDVEDFDSKSPERQEELKTMHALLNTMYEKMDAKWKKSMKLPPPPPPAKAVVKEVDRKPVVREVYMEEHIKTYENLLSEYDESVKAYGRDKSDKNLKEVILNHDKIMIKYNRASVKLKEKLQLPPPPPPTKEGQLERVRREIQKQIPPPPPPKKSGDTEWKIVPTHEAEKIYPSLLKKYKDKMEDSSSSYESLKKDYNSLQSLYNYLDEKSSKSFEKPLAPKRNNAFEDGFFSPFFDN